MQRQELLHADPPVELSAVLNEAVLLRPVGGPDVMARQLAHLVKVSRLPNVTIQILPFAAGGHPAMTTPYVIIGFADPADEPIVYLDNLSQGHAFADPDYVEGYTLVHQKLRNMALTPDESVVRMTSAARDFR
jgi:hypothetical protein